MQRSSDNCNSSNNDDDDGKHSNSDDCTYRHDNIDSNRGIQQSAFILGSMLC